MNKAAAHIVIGSDGEAFAVARGAAERGYEAMVLVPRGLPSVKQIPHDVRAFDLDPRDGRVLPRFLKDAGVVYYCAGTATLPIDEDEPVRMAAIIDGVSRTKARFVYCDAPFVYGQTGRALSEDMPARARDPLGAFLSALAQFVLAAHKRGTIDAVIARHADLYGPQVVRSLYGEAFLGQVLEGRPVSVLGRSTTPRSMTFAPDLGRALVLLAEQPDASGQVWHLPSASISPEKFISIVRHVGDLTPMPKGAIHEIRSQRPFGTVFGERHKAQRMLARYFESQFTLLSAKFERGFGMHATPVRDALAETVAGLKRELVPG